MSSEVLQPIYSSLTSFADVFTHEIHEMIATSEQRLYILETFLCIFLVFHTLYYFNRQVILFLNIVRHNIDKITPANLYQTLLIRIPYRLRLYIMNFVEISLYVTFVILLMLSLYHSLYDDTKASFFCFLLVALVAWTEGLVFPSIEDFEHLPLKIIDLASYLLLVDGVVLIVLRNVWTTPFYLISLWKILQNALLLARTRIMLDDSIESRDSSVESVEDSIASALVNNMPEKEVFERVFVDADKNKCRIDLYNFLELEECSVVNVIINSYFLVLMFAQEWLSLTREHNTLFSVKELKRIMSNFARTLMSREHQENKDQSIHNEIRLENCHEISFLVSVFVQQLLEIHRRESKQLVDDREIDEECKETKLLLSEYVQLINDFIRQLALIRGIQNKNLDNDDGSVTDAADGRVRDFRRHANMQRSENQSLSSASDIEKTMDHKSEENIESVENLYCAEWRSELNKLKIAFNSLMSVLPKNGNATGDALDGNATGDALVGNATGDTLVGNATDDTLVGNATDDTLVGNATDDTLECETIECEMKTPPVDAVKKAQSYIEGVVNKIDPTFIYALPQNK